MVFVVRTFEVDMIDGLTVHAEVQISAEYDSVSINLVPQGSKCSLMKCNTSEYQFR